MFDRLARVGARLWLTCAALVPLVAVAIYLRARTGIPMTAVVVFFVLVYACASVVYVAWISRVGKYDKHGFERNFRLRDANALMAVMPGLALVVPYVVVRTRWAQARTALGKEGPAPHRYWEVLGSAPFFLAFLGTSVPEHFQNAVLSFAAAIWCWSLVLTAHVMRDATQDLILVEPRD